MKIIVKSTKTISFDGQIDEDESDWEQEPATIVVQKDKKTPKVFIEPAKAKEPELLAVHSNVQEESVVREDDEN